MPHISPTPEALDSIKGILAASVLHTYFRMPAAQSDSTSQSAPAVMGGSTRDSLEDRLPAIDYFPVSEILRPRYETTARYAEQVFAELHMPVVRDSYFTLGGTSILGLHYVGTKDIRINYQLHAQLGIPVEPTIFHEKTHERDLTPHSDDNEVRTRTATLSRFNYASDQLGFGAYHP